MDIRKWHDKYSIDIQLIYNSEATKKNYKSQVLSFLNHFKNEIEPKSIDNEKIKLWLLEAQTVNSRKHRMCAITSFYKVTIAMPNKIAKIPYPKSERKLPVVLSQEEVQKLFTVCENMKHKLILALLYSCGLRVSELINLQWKNIDRSRKIINIVSGKGNKDRQVMLSETIIPLLENYYRVYRTKNYILAGQFSEQYSATSVNQVLKQLAAKANINKRIYAHLMRHNSFTHMLENGTDINLIQKLAGHRDVKTTLLYTQISTALISKIQSPLSNIQL